MAIITTMTPTSLRAALQPFGTARSEAKSARVSALGRGKAAFAAEAGKPALEAATLRRYGTHRHHPSRFSPPSLAAQV